MAKIEIETSRGVLSAHEYDDGIANGLRIMLDDEIIALVDIYREAMVADGFVDHCHEIINEDGEDCNNYRVDIERNIEIEYCKSEILKMVNNRLNCEFEEIMVLPRIAGYYVHGDSGGYNLMDDFVYDEARIAQSVKILNYFEDFERFVFCKEYPIASCYWENGKFNVWFSYYEFNDKFIIDDIFNYSFDYKIPPEDFLAKQRVYSDKGIIKDNSTYAEAAKRQEEFYRLRRQYDCNKRTIK